MVKVSDAELEVLKIIWDKTEVTSVEIIKELEWSKWNFNTIRTLIKRLQNKGAIKVIGQEGKTYKYGPAISEVDYKNNAVKELIKKLYNNSFKEFVLTYCENENVTKEEMRELVKNIQNKLDKIK